MALFFSHYPMLMSFAGVHETGVATMNEKLAEFRREFPEINLHQEGSWSWQAKGMSLLECGAARAAADQFKRLILAEPEQYEGYEGLALALRQLGDKNSALLFMMEAVSQAQRLLAEGSLDSDILEELKEELQQVEMMPPLTSKFNTEWK
jgi:tetratricopeptide (TPR) repeat protein